METENKQLELTSDEAKFIIQTIVFFKSVASVDTVFKANITLATITSVENKINLLFNQNLENAKTSETKASKENKD